MFTNDDKQFLSDLNDKLANSISKAMGVGPTPGGGSGGGGNPTDKNTEAVRENTKAERKGALAMTAGAFAFRKAAAAVGSVVKEGMSFGDNLARSALATGRSMQLMGAKYDSSTKTFTNQMPNLSSAFHKFNFRLPEIGKMMDTAIRMNVRETGKGTQKLIATSVGLGNNLATTSKFISTQTNVLGLSTEATNSFGQSIVASAAANGILADSIFEAVNAFTDTAKEQMVFFGRASTQVTNKAIENMAKFLPESDVASLMKALTAPDTVKMLPFIAGTLGLPTPGNLEDPQQMKALISSVIPALAEMGAGTGGDIASIEFMRQMGRTAPIFEAGNIQTAMRLVEEMGKAGVGMSDLHGSLKLTNKSVNDFSEGQRRMSAEANAAAIALPLMMETLGGVRIALDEATIAIRDLPKQFSKLGNTLGATETFLDKFGTSLLATGTFIGGAVLTALTRGRAARLFSGAARGARGASAATGAAGAAGAAAKMSRADMLKSLTQAERAKFGISSTGGITKQGAQALGQKAGTISNANLEKIIAGRGAGAGSRLGGALKTGGKVLGKLATPIAGGIAGYGEYQDSGDMSRAVTRGAAEAGGVWASMAAGAGVGTLIGGPAGTVIGGLAGLIGSFWAAPAAGDLAVAAHDAMGFYEDQEQMIQDIQNKGEAPPVSDEQEVLEVQRVQTEYLEGIFQNTLGTNVAGQESSRFRFNTPPEWQRGSGDFFNSPSQR